MKTLIILYLLMMPALSGKDFKSEQLRNTRVQNAYESKGKEIRDLLKSNGIHIESMEIYIRAFKKEQIIELWARNKNSNFILLKNYPFCASSGNPGPKRKIGDNQIPEGFYIINRFNPNSNFYLALGINYPNSSDKIICRNTNSGRDIFIHGNCVTIGCIPITDDKIKELYIFAVEAKNNGQENIPVHIFPTKLNDEGMKILVNQYGSEKELLSFWQNLKPVFDFFEKTKTLPLISVMKDGRYRVEY
jgi:murein L,D-transpeptidase YafK